MVYCQHYQRSNSSLFYSKSTVRLKLYLAQGNPSLFLKNIHNSIKSSVILQDDVLHLCIFKSEMHLLSPLHMLYFHTLSSKYQKRVCTYIFYIYIHYNKVSLITFMQFTCSLVPCFSSHFSHGVWGFFILLLTF